MKKYFYLLALSFIMISTACTAQLRIVNPVTNRTFNNNDLAAIYLKDSLIHNQIKISTCDTLIVSANFDSTRFYYSNSNTGAVIYDYNNGEFLYLSMSSFDGLDTNLLQCNFQQSDTNFITIRFALFDTLNSFFTSTAIYKVEQTFLNQNQKFKIPTVNKNMNQISFFEIEVTNSNFCYLRNITYCISKE